MKRFIPVLILCNACATVAPTGPVIELDPLVLTTKNGKVRAIEARSLFQEASKDYEEGRNEAAIRKFREVADYFSDSKYAPHALFNLGLAAMRTERWQEANDAFADAEKGLKGKDIWDARFQQMLCLEELKAWKPLLALSRRFLKKAKLTVTQRVETRVREGMALYHLGQLARAERKLEAGLSDYRENNAIPSLQRNQYVSQAQYLIGEMYRGLFDHIRFQLPVEKMKRDLTDKSAFFLKAQRSYLRCVRFSHPNWSVAAGFQLGKLYEDFYDDMMEAEIPPDLDDDDKTVYFNELKAHIKPLVVRSIEIYERNIAMSDRLGQTGEWKKKTTKRLDRMRDILRREFGDKR